MGADGSTVSRAPLAPVTADFLGRADVRAAVAATDWADHAVLDVVDYRLATCRRVVDDRRTPNSTCTASAVTHTSCTMPECAMTVSAP